MSPTNALLVRKLEEDEGTCDLRDWQGQNPRGSKSPERGPMSGPAAGVREVPGPVPGEFREDISAASCFSPERFYTHPTETLPNS